MVVPENKRIFCIQSTSIWLDCMVQSFLGVIPMAIIRPLLPAPLMAALVLTALTGISEPAAAACSNSPGVGVDWADCRKRNLILSGSTLTDADMSGADLASTDLRDSKLDGVNFTKATLLRTYMNASTLVGANFNKAVGYRTHFDGANLTGADLEKSEMQRADFSNATLRDVNFSKSELGRARFAGATIDNANFDFANLARAEFRGANISGDIQFTQAFLYRTRLEGQDLSGATGLVQSQIDISCGDENTVLPAGLVPPAGWPCQEE
jgi:uncharacterized protein YjbI with pentapeptide repeats